MSWPLKNILKKKSCLLRTRNNIFKKKKKNPRIETFRPSKLFLKNRSSGLQFLKKVVMIGTQNIIQ